MSLTPAATGWELGPVSFLGEPITMLLPDRRDGSLYAVLTLGHFGTKLQRSTDGGATWTELTAPVYPEDARLPPGHLQTTERPASLMEIWSLEAGGPDQPGRLWAGTIPGGLFRSDDGGQSWAFMRSLWDRAERQKWMGGGKDEPGIHSITVDPRDSRRVTIGISCGGVWQTQDDGETWENVGYGLRAEYLPPELANDLIAQDPHRLVACPAAPDRMWIQHHNGIFRSDNAGRDWVEIENVLPSPFGFAVAVHPQRPDTAWFVPAADDSCRVPTDGRFVVTKTTDGKTFAALDGGLPASQCYDIVYRHALDVDSSGEMLVLGTTTGNVWASRNGGDAWTEVSHRLPPVYCVRFGT